MTDPRSKLLSMLDVAKKATQGKLSIERKELDCGYFNFVVYGSRDFASCDEMTDWNAKQNAAHIATANPQAFTAIVESLIEALEALEKSRCDLKYPLVSNRDGPKIKEEHDPNCRKCLALGSITARLEKL